MLVGQLRNSSLLCDGGW